MKDVPTERLDAIATSLIRDAGTPGACRRRGIRALGGMITFLPDASLLTVIHPAAHPAPFSLVYGVWKLTAGDQRIEMWKAAAAASRQSTTAKGFSRKADSRKKLSPRIAGNAWPRKIWPPKRRKNGLGTFDSSGPARAIGGAPELFVCERLGPGACSAIFRAKHLEAKNFPRFAAVEGRLHLNDRKKIAASGAPGFLP